MSTETPSETETTVEIQKPRRGRPRKNPVPKRGAASGAKRAAASKSGPVSAEVPVAGPSQEPVAVPSQEPVAVPSQEPVAVPSQESVAVPEAGPVFGPGPSETAAVSPEPASAAAPAVPAAAPVDVFSLPEPEELPSDSSLDADMRARREAAMRMKRGIDDMSDSIAAMQAFFAKKTSTQTAMAQQAKSLAGKAAKQAARAQAAKEAEVKAAAARIAEASKPQPLQQPFPGKVRVDRWGRPVNPAAASAPAPGASQAAQRKAPPPVPAAAPNPSLPVLNMLELQRCGAGDLASLVEEAKLDDKTDAAFASRHDIVLALLAEHARRGGAVEGEGVFVPVKDQAGCLVSPLNGLRRTPADVRVSAQFAAASGLRPGDYVVCRAVQNQGVAGRGTVQFEAADAVSVNGLAPAKARRKLPFDAFPPRVPSRRIAIGAEPGASIAGALAEAPLAEGGRALAVFLPGPSGPRVAPGLVKLAAQIKAANAWADVVLALSDPDPGTLAALAARAAADRDAGRAPAFEAIAQDPGDHPDRATTFAGTLCDWLRRRAANGRRVVFVTDLPGPVSPGFARSLPGSTALAPDSAAERECAEFRRLWGSARDLDGAGSLTVFAAVRIVSKCDEALAAHLRGVADWTADFTAAPGGAAVPVAGSVRSRHDASALRAVPPEAESAPFAEPVFRAPVEPRP